MYMHIYYIASQLYSSYVFLCLVFMHALYRVLATWMSQAESSLANNFCESIHSQYSLTTLQMQECKKYPELVKLSTTKVVKVFSQQCQYQFRHEKWNCRDNSPPIFGVIQPFSTLRKRLLLISQLASQLASQLCTNDCVAIGVHCIIPYSAVQFSHTHLWLQAWLTNRTQKDIVEGESSTL